MIHSTAPVFENLNASNWCRAVYCSLQLFSLRVVLGVGPGHCSGSVSCVSCINTVMLAGRGSHLSCFSFTIFFFLVSLYFTLFMFGCAGSSWLHGLSLFLAVLGGYSHIAVCRYLIVVLSYCGARA